MVGILELTECSSMLLVFATHETVPVPYLAPPWLWVPPLTWAWARLVAADYQGSLAVKFFDQPSLVGYRGFPLLLHFLAAPPGASFCCAGQLPGTPDLRGTRSTHPHKTPATTKGANFFSGGCVTGANLSQMEVMDDSQ